MIALWITLLAVMSCMLLLWVASIFRRDVSLVDAFWGAGFVIVAWIAWSLHGPATPRATLLVALVTLWGLRLSLYLLWRRLGQPEDRRYAALREATGASFWWRSLLTVFLFQGLILWFVSWPIQFGIAGAGSELGFVDALGIVLYAIGFTFETIGDWQLARFKSNPQNRGQVFDRGLWRYTRHPNYFGDFCVWWGLYCIVCAAGGWWTILSPLVMSFLLIRISGVVLLERTMGDRTGYRAYQRRTSSFVPWPPKTDG